jgi:hypothetical protein
MTSTIKSEPDRPSVTGYSGGAWDSAAMVAAVGLVALGFGAAGWAAALPGNGARVAAPPAAMAVKKPRRFTPVFNFDIWFPC